MNPNLANFDRQENSLSVRLFSSHSYDRSFSFQKLLQKQLLTATIKYLERAETPIPYRNSLLLDKITRSPLHLDRQNRCWRDPQSRYWHNRYLNTNGYFYRSAVCFSLASHVRMSPLTIARQLREIILNLDRDQADTIALETLGFTVEANEAGWLDFFPDDRTLAIWLSWLSTSNYTPFRSTSTINDNIFPIQYSHARCRSLLLLAARQELINLSDDYFNNPRETILFSDKKKYLERDNRLIFEEDLELDLIEALMRISDFLDTEYYSDRLLKIAFSLSESFLSFYDSSPFFNSRNRKQIIQARLGLIATVDFFLERILRQLNIEPLQEL